jgi:hypothetical protein
MEDSFSGTRLKREGTILCLVEGRFLAILLKYILDSRAPLSLFLLMVASNFAIAEWMLAFFLLAMVMIGVCTSNLRLWVRGCASLRSVAPVLLNRIAQDE